MLRNLLSADVAETMSFVFGNRLCHSEYKMGSSGGGHLMFTSASLRHTHKQGHLYTLVHQKKSAFVFPRTTNRKKVRNG